MIHIALNDAPTLAPADYAPQFTEPCVLVHHRFQNWYFGTGIAPREHPLWRNIDFGPCAHCKNTNVLIIAAQWVVHPHSGDVYWDYEAHCAACGKFTAGSYAENS